MMPRLGYILTIILLALVTGCTDNSYDGVLPDGSSVYTGEDSEQLPVLLAMGIPDEIMTKGEGIYKTIVTAILCLLGTPVIFVFPVGTSFIFSHILCVRKKTNLLVAWVMSFFVIPATFAGLYFSRFSFELLYRYLFLLLLIIVLLSLFYSKAKWIIAIVSLYSLYFAELYFLEILVAV